MKCSFFRLKATPHKARLTTLYVINLYIFRHITQKFLAIRKYACEISMQSDEKSDCVSAAQSLCGVALKFGNEFLESVATFLEILEYTVACGGR